MTALTKTKCYALIPCAGSGIRAGFDTPKQYQTIAGKPVVQHTLDAFSCVAGLTQTWLVLAPDDPYFDHTTHQSFKCGGQTRDQTVANGLQAMLDVGCKRTDWVLVHDAARCLIEPQQIAQMIQTLQSDEVGGILAHKVADTLKQSNSTQSNADAHITATVDRVDKWAAQTPQMFKIGALLDALKAAQCLGARLTDEASAMELAGYAPRLIEGGAQNFKLTYPEDFAMAQAILRARQTASTAQTPSAPQTRIGQGWDVHRLVDQASTGRKLILGGIEIPFTKGLLGHSDADALCHAITDALLGAAGLGDIGRHFPDTDPAFKGADSTVLLRHAASLVGDAGFQIGNVDATILAQAPKLAPHMEAIRNNVATVLGLDTTQVNVKAKTAEGLGAVGAGESIECQAIAMLHKSA